MVLATHKERHRAIGIMRTWGAQCDRLVFFADFDEPSIGAIDIHAAYEGSPDTLINKMSRGVRIVNALYGRDYDWFAKADVDSFYIIENLRHFLLTRYPSEADVALKPHYLGEYFNKDGNTEAAFNPGVGYVLNRAALRLLACSYNGKDTCGEWRHSAQHLSRPLCVKGFPGYDCKCEPDKRGNHEDVMTAVCLKLWGVTPDDVRDLQGRDYFYAYFDAPTAYKMAPPNASDAWFYKYSLARTDSDDYRKRLATYPIVFHRYTVSHHHQVHAAARARQGH